MSLLDVCAPPPDACPVCHVACTCPDAKPGDACKCGHEACIHHPLAVVDVTRMCTLQGQIADLLGRPLDIYVTSKLKHAPLWRALRRRGLNIRATWIDLPNSVPQDEYAPMWRQFLTDISYSHLLIAYYQPGEIAKGGLIEIGAALMDNCEVYLIGDTSSFQVGDESDASFTGLRHFHRAGTINEILANFLGLLQQDAAHPA
jgi:hypothetical protein